MPRLLDKKKNAARFWDRTDIKVKEQNTTYADVATAMGINPGNFSSWKARKTFPNVDYATQIAKQLGTSVEYLVDGDEKKNFKPSDRVADFYEILLKLDTPSLESIRALAKVLYHRSRGEEITWPDATEGPSAPAEAAVSPELRRATSGGRPLLNNKKKKDII